MHPSSWRSGDGASELSVFSSAERSHTRTNAIRPLSTSRLNWRKDTHTGAAVSTLNGGCQKRDYKNEIEETVNLGRKFSARKSCAQMAVFFIQIHRIFT